MSTQKKKTAKRQANETFQGFKDYPSGTFKEEMDNKIFSASYIYQAEESPNKRPDMQAQLQLP